MKSTQLLLLAAVLLGAACVLPAAAQDVPGLVNYEGVLTGMPDGDYGIEFRLWNKISSLEEGNILIWGRKYTVAVVNGTFRVVLGAEGGILADVPPPQFTELKDSFREGDRFLELTIVDTPSGPLNSVLARQRIASAPYALASPSGVPLGSIQAFIGLNAPDGWLLCNGDIIDYAVNPAYERLVKYLKDESNVGTGNDIFGGDGITQAKLPDLRGVFLRGLDNGRGLDPDGSRLLGSHQQDELKSHTHQYSKAFYNAYQHPYGGGQASNYIDDSAQTGAAGGAETRPKNVAVNYLIKY